MEEINKNLENLSKQLDALMQVQNAFYSKLPKEQFEKVKQHQEDANQMMREFKAGNFSNAEKIIDKYANFNKK